MRYLKLTFLFICALAVGVLLATLAVHHFGALADTRQLLDRWGFILMCVRLSLIAALWWFWDALADRLYTPGSSIGDYFKSRRNVMAMLLVIIELVIVQNVIGDFFLITGAL